MELALADIDDIFIERIAHKMSALSLMEQAYVSINHSLMPREQPIIGVLKEQHKVALTILDESIKKHQLEALIKSCNCMPDITRQIVGQLCHQEARSQLLSDIITMVSIGSGNLKQELMTAESLMAKGYHVQFILIEPTYYQEAMRYPVLNYLELKSGFDKIALDLSHQYGKFCHIVAVYPSVYFYLKDLMASLEQPIDEAFFSKDTEVFKQPSPDRKLFFLRKEIEGPEQDNVVNQWHNQHPKDILIIQVQDHYFFALNFDINDPGSFFIAKSKMTPDQMAYLSLCCLAPKAIPIEIAIVGQSFNWIERSWRFSFLNSALTLAANQVQLCLEGLAQKKPPVAPTALLPNVILLVDSNEKYALSEIQDFFINQYASFKLCFNPLFIHHERSFKAPQPFHPHAALEGLEMYTPPVLLRNFCYKTHNTDGQEVQQKLPERVVNCIESYLKI